MCEEENLLPKFSDLSNCCQNYLTISINSLKSVKNRLGAVHKLRLQEEGGRWSKKSTFYKLLYYRKCTQRGLGGQKK